MGFDMNYKIKVGNEVGSKEAQKNLEQLGFKKSVWGIFIHNSYFIFAKSNYYSRDDIENFHECDYKEITLPELRDLVVLKRNDRKDANVSEDSCLYDLYLTESKELYFYHCGKKKWILSNLNGDDDYYKLLKPIEKKEMKEYLEKQPNGSYVMKSGFALAPAGWIEIPEGAFSLKENFIFFNQDSSKFYSCTGEWENTPMTNRLNILWQRESPNDKLASAEQYRQAEVLPFIDDEPKSAWDTQVGGDHYKKYKIQPMLFALENNLNPLQHSVLKYIMRHEDKNGKQDLEKAKHYIDLMIAHYYPAE